MRTLRLATSVIASLSLMAATPAQAAPPHASCPGQVISAFAQELGADLGAFVAFEAHNPELEGWRSFGEEISTFAHADRLACPEE